MRSSYDPFHSEIDKAVEINDPSSVPAGFYGLLRRIKLKSVGIYSSKIVALVNHPIQRITFDGHREVYLAPSPKLREKVTLEKYANALEEGSIVDILFRRLTTDFEGVLFWFTVQYRNESLRQTYMQTRWASLKPDALFAYRLGHSEKAVRLVVRKLLSLGHDIPADILKEKMVIIDYARGRDRTARPDIRCTRCSRRFEVKSRTDDFFYRFSHSYRRPFWNENAPEDYNILVFPDWHIEAFRNSDLQAIIEKLSPDATERYDKFVQLSKEQAEKIRLNDSDLRCRG